jgi:hypothetical protein
MKKIDFETLKEFLLYRRIVEWNTNTIVLDNGVKISIEETDQDCCASAQGEFADVKLDAAITNITPIKYEPWDDGDTYGCSAQVKFLHNRNAICKAEADSNAGNGGYYYSIASFIVTVPGDEESLVCHFVSSDD